MKNYQSLKFLFVLVLVGFFLSISLFNTLYSQEKTKKPKLDIQNRFIASGYMGDGEYGEKYIKFDGAFETKPHSSPNCIKITYTFGPNKWAGIYWQNKPDNWGDRPGNNYSKKGFTKVTFWAKGETGKKVVEFKSGDIYNAKKKYHDSYGESTGRLTLTNEWTKYEIDLEGADLSSVIGGFCWVASKDYNSQKSITFYIDDIYFE